MRETITVRRQTGELTAREYDFMLLDNALRCVAYREVGRQSRRQKTERTTLLWSWHRVDRSCETPRIEWVDVPFGDAIAADALAALVSKIHVLPPEAT